MKPRTILLSLSIIGALVVSQAASADNRNFRRGYSDYGFGHGGYRNSYRHFNRGYRRPNAYHYPARDRRYRSGFSFSYGNYYPRHRHYDAGGFVGGLVLGSLFSYPRRSYDTVVYRNVPATRTREIVYVDRPQPVSRAPVASGRRLLRDLEGNCFERIVDEQGDEIRVQLEPEECNF